MLLFENGYLWWEGNFSWEAGLVPYSPGLAHGPSNKAGTNGGLKNLLRPEFQQKSPCPSF